MVSNLDGLLKRLALFTAEGFLVSAAWAASGFEELGQNPAFRDWLNRQTPGKAASVRAGSSGRADGWIPICADMSFLVNSSTSRYNPTKAGAGHSGNALPASFDSRTRGWITGVRDQGEYGTCWAHAAMASLESWVLKSEGVSYDFSENNLANLHGFAWDFNSGGNGHLATAYFLRWGGPVTEQMDAYPNWGGSRPLSAVRHVQAVKLIPQRASLTDNDLLKTAVMDYGAVMVAYYEGSASAYYNESTGGRYCPRSNGSNHAVTLVGWDDNYSRENFLTRPPGDGAFIIKNSWGSRSRKNGYFYISYYDQTFCLDSPSYAFASAEKPTNFDAVYEYDPYGQCTAYSARYGANVFTATDRQELSAIGFYALAPHTEYEIEVYSGCDRTNPRSGTRKHVQDGVTVGDFAGYFTVPLSQNIWLEKGERFSVVVHFASTPGCQTPLAVEKLVEGYSINASAAAGEGFCSNDGKAWTDLTSISSTASFCCKAYVKKRKAEALPEEYTLHFDANGGKGSMPAKTYRFDAPSKVLPRNTFTRVGYRFLGWSLDQNGKYAQRKDLGDASFIQTSWGLSHTLFAVWEPVTYDVELVFDDPVARNVQETFGNMGLSENPKSTQLKMTYDSIGSLPCCSKLGWEVSGYSFAGWSASPGGPMAYRDGQGILNLLSQDGGRVSLYTVWDHAGEVTETEITGPICVTGGAAQAGPYHLKLQFSGGSFEWVRATWSVSYGNSIASIDSTSGALVTHVVSELTTIGLIASYSYRGETYSAEYEVFVFPRGRRLVRPYRIDFDPAGADIKTTAILSMLCERDCVHRLSLPAGGMHNGSKRLAGWLCSKSGKRYDDGILIFNLAEPGETVTMTAIWE